ncbi:helix-turn-helix domain-containing protein [Haloactinospora alba]|uniref:helix-turn-helix domain-containing protein n=1 Tax=Haloactinospora alba TaxID=405555 RepID=UPI001151E29F|nr:helix-turn-helix transcriptional regulator [Haloactinospora alba]
MVVENDGVARKVGAEVRRLRRYAGYSQQALADRIPVSQSALSDIERGRAHTKKDQVERIDHILTARGRLVATWETQHEEYIPPEWYKQVPEMERQATEIQDYNPLVIPGMLQTEPYAQAVIRAGDRVAADERVQAKARARVERQEVLHHERPPFFLAVVDETVLYRRLGSPEAMRGQLGHLREVSAWPRTEILVVPSRTWDHPGLDGGFHLLKVPGIGTIVYQEARSTGSVSADPKIVDTHLGLLGHLRGVALPPDQSRILVEKAYEEYS